VNLGPLREAPLVSHVHAVAALLVFTVGVFLLAAPMGTWRHRVTGWDCRLEQ
jgi:uncharacterized membrane protein